MLVIKQLMVPIDFHSIYFSTMEVNGNQQLFGSSTFFKISSFVLNIRKKCIQFWNEMRVSKWRKFHFGVNYSFKMLPTQAAHKAREYHIKMIKEKHKKELEGEKKKWDAAKNKKKIRCPPRTFTTQRPIIRKQFAYGLRPQTSIKRVHFILLLIKTGYCWFMPLPNQ